MRGRPAGTTGRRVLGVLATFLALALALVAGPAVGPAAAAESGVTVSPMTHDWGSVRVGEAGPWLEVKVAAGDYHGRLSASAEAGIELDYDNYWCGENATCFRARFVPTQRGGTTPAIHVHVVDADETITVTTTGVGLDNALELTPSLLDLGELGIGSPAPTQTFTVTNVGDFPVTGLTVGTTAQLQLVGPECGASLAVGASCTVEARPSTSSAGSWSSALWARADDTAEVTSAVSWLVTAQAPELSPGLVDFGQVVVGDSVERTIALTNVTDSTLFVEFWAFPSDVSAVTSDCHGALGPQQSCSFQVTFQPRVVGHLHPTFQVGTSLGNVTTTLVGTGVPLSVTPTATDLGTVSIGHPATSEVEIRNHSTDAVPLTLTATDGPFSVSDDCPATLPGGESCTTVVTYVPETAGEHTASLTVSTPVADTAQSVPVALSGSGREVSLSADPIDFGTVEPDGGLASTPVTNTGTAPVMVTGVSTDAPFRVGDGTTCGGWLAPGATCSVEVAASNPAPGPTTGSLQLVHPGGRTTVPLMVFAADRSVTMTPTSLDLGSAPVGTVTAAELVVTNTGNVPLTLDGLTAPSAVSADLSACPADTLAPQENCTIELEFNHDAPGLFNGALVLTTSSGELSTTLSATSTPLQVSATVLDLGDVTVGHTSTTSLAVTNLADVAVPLGLAGLGSPFSLSGDCPESLPGNATCTVEVTFLPEAAGPAGSSLTVGTPGDGSLQSVVIEVDARGHDAELSLTSLDLGSVALGASTSTTATLTNDGVAPVTLGVVVVDAPFGTGSTDCATALAPGEHCQLQVTFSPTEPGTATAELAVEFPNGSVAATMTGFGVLRGLEVSTGSVDFGAVLAGTDSDPVFVTVTNTGNVPASIGESAMTGPFEVLGDDCSGELAPGAECTVGVIHTPGPDDDGALTGSLTISDSGATGPVGPVGPTGPTTAAVPAILRNLVGADAVTGTTVTVELAGFAAVVGVGSNVSTHDFGTVAVGEQSALKVSLTNAGNLPVLVDVDLNTGPDLIVDAAGCEAVLEPGASCVMVATFAPLGEGRLDVAALVGGIVELATGEHNLEAFPIILTGVAEAAPAATPDPTPEPSSTPTPEPTAAPSPSATATPPVPADPRPGLPSTGH